MNRFVRLVDEANDFLSSFGHSDNTVFILELLFYIYICDQAASAALKHKTAYEQSGNDLRENNAVYSVKRASFPEEVLTNKDIDLVSSLNTALIAIETINNDRLVNFFETVRARNTMYNSTSTSWAAILRKLLKILLRIRFTQHAEVLELQQGFDQVLDRLSLNRKGFFASHTTPRQIIRLMVNLVSPKAGETIYDPACGAGALLIAATTAAENTSAFGQDINVDACSLAKINFVLNGSCDSQIIKGDTLRNPYFVCGSQKLKLFDVVVCDPPFSLHNWGARELAHDAYNRFDYGLPPARNGDWAFISHIIKSIKTHGRAAVIVPTGALLRRGDEKFIRQSIIEEGIVDAIVGLPTKLFPSSTTSFAIILLTKPDNSTPAAQDILFIDARDEYDTTKARKASSFEERIVEAYRARETGGSARVVSLVEIRDNEYSLDIAKYLRISDNPIKISEVEDKIAQIEKRLLFIKQNLSYYRDLI